MKRIFLLLWGLAMSTMLLSQNSPTTKEREVQQTVINFFEAISNRDSTTLKKYMTADIELLEYGSLWNADTLIKKAIKSNTSSDFIRKNTFDFLSTHVHKKTAWLTYHLYSDITKDRNQSSVHWLETVVLIKEKKSWKIKLLHSTLISRT
ncbi:MAG: nuclear transport factor 2 family protein [Saprospiraceae bacterium]|nr:nuclear transport factor 2 family protein [Candidatus Vicinibacter affinis]